MLAIEDRLKKWGADEVIYDDGVSYTNWDTEMDDRKAAAVRVIETLRGDGDAFDAVLDLVGGQEIQEASERLLKLNGCLHGVGQFTSLLVANALDDPIPTLADNFRPNLANLSTFTLPDLRSYTNEHTQGFRDFWSGDMKVRRVKHTLMEGVFESEEEVCEILRTVLRLALEDGIRPHVEEVGGELFGRRRSVSLEKVSDVMMDGDLLSDGGIVVVRVVR
jgi:NADPH:quinone reductase-like Zn-dependent oxidoreductase